MILTPAQYYDIFIRSRNFLEAPVVNIGEIGVDIPRHYGGHLVLLDEMFPGAQIIEYHFPAQDEELGGFDRKSLYLVFLEEDDELLLRAIASNQWSP